MDAMGDVPVLTEASEEKCIMKISKRIGSALLSLMLLLSLYACGTKESALDSAARWLQTTIPEPTIGSVAGEWLILGLARAEMNVPENYYEEYYARITAYVEEKEGILHEKKITEHSRVILALTAIGKDPTDVGGYDLLLPLGDFEKTIFQGINGPIFALLALDSGNYEIPHNDAAGTQATRERYVQHILEQELPDGGWTLAGGTPDADITAMALQALAKYSSWPEVTDAVERGLAVLSEMQSENGGFITYGAECSETVSQILIALCELGVDISEPRFMKNGKTLKEKLLEFQMPDGSFCHEMGGGADLMATEQAVCALAALDRIAQGKSSLYTMVDEK